MSWTNKEPPEFGITRWELAFRRLLGIVALISMIYVAILCGKSAARPPLKALSLVEIDRLKTKATIVDLCWTAKHSQCVDLSAKGVMSSHFADFLSSEDSHAATMLQDLPANVAAYMQMCRLGSRPPEWLFLQTTSDAEKKVKIDYRSFLETAPQALVPLFVTLRVHRSKWWPSYVVVYIVTDTVTPYQTPEVIAEGHDMGAKLGVGGVLQSIVSRRVDLPIEIGWGAVMSYYVNGDSAAISNGVPPVSVTTMSRHFPDLTSPVRTCSTLEKLEDVAHRWRIEYDAGANEVVGPNALITAVEYQWGESVARTPWVFVRRSGIIDISDSWLVAGKTLPTVLPTLKKVFFISELSELNLGHGESVDLHDGWVEVTDLEAHGAIDLYKDPACNASLVIEPDTTENDIRQGWVRLLCPGGRRTKFSIPRGCFLNNCNNCNHTLHRSITLHKQ